ncbi:bpX6 domain-containing protein [Embleya sp. NPDC005575]|uniref:bpX6 domain-containing protein n=1 Tax=Embleya sp. NPDC005575 TaxID=3156892 RepID=UPI0033A60354
MGRVGDGSPGDGGGATGYRGTVRAVGFVLDVPVLGRDEAAARVLALWDQGAALHELPDGRWLLRLGAERVVRAEQAPGTPLVAWDQALVEPGLRPEPGDEGHLVGSSGGRRTSLTLSGLPVMTPGAWLRVDGLPIHRLPALDTPDPCPDVPIESPLRSGPNLRAKAGVGRRDAHAERIAAEVSDAEWTGPGGTKTLPDPRSAPVAFLAMVVQVGLVALGAGGAIAALGALTGGRAPIAVLGPILVGAVLLWRRRTRGAYAATGQPAGQARKSKTPAAGRAGLGRSTPRRRRLLRRLRVPGRRLAALLLRSPLAHVWSGRQERYLLGLVRAFERGRFEIALRNAIALSDSPDDAHSGPLALGLPRPRTGELRPAARVGPWGARMPTRPSMFEQLRVLYGDAAERLERAGRIDEAAFVLADLLDSPDAAVEVYTRHDRFRDAAELAENRALAPDLVVGLWWRAGERDRAVTHARLYGAFATAIERLTPGDPETASALRAAWVAACQAAGDHLGAVEAAWPDPERRPTVAADLTAGIAQGGAIGARLLAFLATEAPVEQARAAVLAFLAADAERAMAADESAAAERDVADGGMAADREAGVAATVGAVLAAGAGPVAVLADRADLHTFTAALAELSAGDPAWDRELATLAARALVRASGRPARLVGFPTGSGRRRFDALRARADPLVAADLRAPVEPEPARRTGPIAVGAGHFPGRLPVWNAAALPDGTVLVACGAAGTRLLGRDGRERARWDVTAHRIVLADHGSTALLIGDRGVSCDIHRLDSITRRVRHWATLSAREFADSFDGGHLVTLDRGIITVLDTLTTGPRIVWREEAAPASFLAVARTATSCAALAQTEEGAERMANLAKWRWDMPGWMLRERSVLPDRMSRSLVTGTGRVVPVTSESVLVSGGAFVDIADSVVVLYSGTDSESTAKVSFPGAASDTIGFREHAGRVTLWDRSGRVVVLEGSMVRAVFRT